MKFTKAAVTVLCSALLFCGCTKNSNTVLKINDQEITKKEFYGDFNRIKNVQLKNSPDEYKNDGGFGIIALKERYTNDVIIRTLLIQEFNKRKITVSQSELQAKKALIIAQMGSEENFKKVLKENHISDERLNSDLANEVKIEKLLNQTVNIKISDKELEKFYNMHKDQFKIPERIKLSQIFIETNADSARRKIVEQDKDGKLSSTNIDEKVKDEVAKKEALVKDIHAQLVKNPSKFAELAQKYSDDAETAKNGGDMGYVARETVPKEVSDVAFKQKIGVVSPIITSQFGSHIVIVKDKSAAGVQPLSKVKDELKEYLLQQKKGAAFQEYIEGLKNSAKIEYVDESLSPETFKKQLEEVYQKQIKKQEKLQKQEVEKQAKIQAQEQAKAKKLQKQQ